MKKAKTAPGSAGERASGDERPLGAVGVSAAEERLYEALLEHPGASLKELARLVRLPAGSLQATMEALELKGMASHSPARVRRYFPTPPDVAVEALILNRQEAFQRARAAASRLQSRQRKAPAEGDVERVVEVITGRDALVKVVEHIQRTAKHEVICFDRPPYVSSPGVAVNELQLRMMAQGIRYRDIYDHSALDLPGAAKRIKNYVDAGEQARVYSPVLLKLIAVDRRVGILPLDLQHPEKATLLVRSCSLLDALYELFEITWARAAPLKFTRSGEEVIASTDGRPGGLDQLLPLLVAGLNDKTIASQLEISQRTLDRRMDEFMRSLEAKTRFQAGWMAALRYDKNS